MSHVSTNLHAIDICMGSYFVDFSLSSYDRCLHPLRIFNCLSLIRHYLSVCREPGSWFTGSKLDHGSTYGALVSY